MRLWPAHFQLQLSEPSKVRIVAVAPALVWERRVRMRFDDGEGRLPTFKFGRPQKLDSPCAYSKGALHKLCPPVSRAN